MRGELNKAKEYIDRAIDVVESDDNRKLPADYLIEKANIYLRQYMKTSDKQYFNEAISVFLRNIENYPNSPNVYDSMGDAFVAAGQYENARKNYAKAIERGPQKAGYPGNVWTSQIVSDYILKRWNVKYHPGHDSWIANNRLLRLK